MATDYAQILLDGARVVLPSSGRLFALPGIILLILTIYLRPQEIFPILQSVPLLHLLMGLSMFGIALDWRLRLSRPTATPQLVWAVTFTIWCVLSLLIKAPPDGLIGELIEAFIPLGLFLIIAHGIQTFRALSVVCVTLLLVCIGLSAVGVDQRFSAKGCHVIIEEGTKDGVYDGRGCETVHDCTANDPEPGADYTCEYVGPFGTSSVGLRVRYRGVLGDPNELALAISIALPFAFALLERRRTLGRIILAILALGSIGMCVVFTESRGGQLVIMAVLGVYFARRYGLRGLVIAGIACLPMLLLGGRSGQEAEASSLERLECWFVGTEMFRDNPIIGVGKNMFVEHHFLTAHNSYVLAPAELGYPGYILWTCLLYLSVKIPYMVVRQGMRARAAAAAMLRTVASASHLPGRPLGPVSAAISPLSPVAETWGLAPLAAILGAVVGVFFLSFCYHYVLWTYFGLCGALYTCVRTHDPTFKVRITIVEIISIAILDLMLLAAIWVYTRGKV
jgi:hypothetical protein